MKRTVIAVITFCVAALGSLIAFSAITLRRIAIMPVTQYAWDTADGSPVNNE